MRDPAARQQTPTSDTNVHDVLHRPVVDEGNSSTEVPSPGACPPLSYTQLLIGPSALRPWLGQPSAYSAQHTQYMVPPQSWLSLSSTYRVLACLTAARGIGHNIPGSALVYADRCHRHLGRTAIRWALRRYSSLQARTASRSSLRPCLPIGSVPPNELPNEAELGWDAAYG